MYLLDTTYELGSASPNSSIALRSALSRRVFHNASQEVEWPSFHPYQTSPGQATWEEYRNVVRTCRDVTRKAKIHLELNLVRDVKDNKKGFFNYISSKRKARDNVRLLLNEVGVLVMEDAEKAELLNAFFASVFSAKAGPQESQALEVREEACGKDYLPLVEEDCVRDHLSSLDAHKSIGLYGMHP